MRFKNVTATSKLSARTDGINMSLRTRGAKSSSSWIAFKAESSTAGVIVGLRPAFSLGNDGDLVVGGVG